MIIQSGTESGLLLVTATGEFSLDEAERTFLEMLDAVAEREVRKVLFDGRALLGEPETMERFYYGDFAAESVAKFADGARPYVLQFAYVLREPVLDPSRFGERTARDRGMYVKCFNNIEEALGWLGAAPAGQPDTGDN